MGSSEGKKRFLHNPRWCPFKIKIKISSASTLKRYSSINTTFDPLYFSLDNTFKGEKKVELMNKWN
jgi:hypothetical protein